MSAIYTSADRLIGKTPLLDLTHIEKENALKATVLAKLEYFNPAGSVKDRIAKAEELAAEIENSFIPGQFVNPANSKQLQRAITPGQAVVLYDGDTVLGGGIIM